MLQWGWNLTSTATISCVIKLLMHISKMQLDIEVVTLSSISLNLWFLCTKLAFDVFLVLPFSDFGFEVILECTDWSLFFTLQSGYQSLIVSLNFLKLFCGGYLFLSTLGFSYFLGCHSKFREGIIGLYLETTWILCRQNVWWVVSVEAIVW